MKKQARNIFGYGLFVILMVIIAVAAPPTGTENWGFWCALPVIFIFAFDISTGHIVEGFVWAGIMAVFIKNRWEVLTYYPDELMNTFMDGDSLYMFLLFLLLGIIFMILKKSGASTYFARAIAKKAKNEKLSLFLTWLCMIPLAVDDYLSAFTIGSCMTPVNDEYKVPREMSAYVVRSAATTPSCLIPIGSWAIWVATLLEQNKLAEAGSGVSVYMKMVPYLFFPIVVSLFALLVIFGVVPKFGRMKKAYERVAAGGPPAPPSVSGSSGEEEDEVVEPKKGVKMIHFIVPLAALFGFGIYYEFNMIYALIWASAVSLVFYIATKIFTIGDATSCVYEGFNYMCEMGVMLIVGYTMSRIVGDLGFTEYIVGLTENLLSPALFPFIVFIVFSITEFMVSFNWTLYLIAMPIVVTLAIGLGVNPLLAVGALISTGVWGYTASFSADGGIVAATACSLDVYEENMAQLPYMLIVWGISAVGYLIAGLIL